MKTLRVCDLFAGTGGFSLGLEQTGRFKTVFANDFVLESKKIFDENFGIKLTLGDIHKLNPDEIPDCDLITAGFPCQPFSLAGEKKGFADERSNVFWRLLEIIDAKKPKIIILENVKNLVTHDNSKTFKVIKKSIKKLGYHIKYQVLDTAKLTGIPQNRQRIYIVGFLDKDQRDKFSFPDDEIDTDDVSDYLEEEVDDDFIYKPDCKIYPVLEKFITKDISENVVYQYRRFYVRENKSRVCPTLVKNMGTGGHNTPIILSNELIRKLTPRECFNLQGFPKNYKLPNDMANSKLYGLAGNAITVPVVKLIGDEILKVI